MHAFVDRVLEYLSGEKCGLEGEEADEPLSAVVDSIVELGEVLEEEGSPSPRSVAIVRKCDRQVAASAADSGRTLAATRAAAAHMARLRNAS